MRLRSFSAESMPAALALVKAELGDDAIILSSEEVKDGVKITAAIEPWEDTLPRKTKPAPTSEPLVHKHQSVDQLRYDVQYCLRYHNIPELFIAKMMATLNDATIASILGKSRMNIANESRHFLKLALEHIAESFFSFASFSTMPRRLMLVGAPGIGKTLTIAKLATRYALAKEKIVVITTDMNRAGGADQLRSFTDILNVPLSVCPDKKALSDALKLAGKDAHILIDTAGCNPYIDEEIANISELTRAGDIGCALVMQAGLDAQEALEITEAFTNLPISRLIGTRMDCTKRYGGLVAAAAGHGLPFAFASDSPSVADNITELTPKTLVQYLFKPDR